MWTLRSFKDRPELKQAAVQVRVCPRPSDGTNSTDDDVVTNSDRNKGSESPSQKKEERNRERMNGMVVATDPITRMTLEDSEESDACLPALSFFSRQLKSGEGGN